MEKQSYKFSSATVDYYFNGDLAGLKEIVDINNSFIITDEHLFHAHTSKFDQSLKDGILLY